MLEPKISRKVPLFCSYGDSLFPNIFLDPPAPPTHPAIYNFFWSTRISDNIMNNAFFRCRTLNVVSLDLEYVFGSFWWFPIKLEGITFLIQNVIRITYDAIKTYYIFSEYLFHQKSTFNWILCFEYLIFDLKGQAWNLYAHRINITTAFF